MPLPAPSGVLLDLDGTLVDTVGLRVEAWARALAEFLVPVDRDAIARGIGSDGKRLARSLAEEHGIPMRVSRAVEIDARHDEIFAELNASPTVLPGVAELAALLDARQVPWAIATSSNPMAAARSVEALSLGTRPVVVDGSHVEHAKPAPDLFLLGAERLGVTDLARCWCVGDATWDMEAARNAGMLPIGVRAGSAVSLPVLRVAGAERVVRDLRELATLLAAAIGLEEAPGPDETAVVDPADGADPTGPTGPA